MNKITLEQKIENKVDHYNDKFKMTIREWFDYYHKNIVMDKSFYLGVPTIKNPMDCWIYQELIYEVKPEVIVEIGSLHGGSTLYFAHLLDQIGNGIVISVDIQRTVYNVKHDRIIEITGDSSSASVLEQVAKICKNKSVMVIHDGDHTKAQVLKDLHAYSPFVTVGSYFIIEDTIHDYFFLKRGTTNMFNGPMSAVIEFLETNDNFIVDQDCERYVFTYNINGFLKKVKHSDVANTSSESTPTKVEFSEFRQHIIRAQLLANFVHCNYDALDNECHRLLWDAGLDSFLFLKKIIKRKFDTIRSIGKCAIYGTGDICEALICQLHDKYDIQVLIDQDEKKWGSTKLGYPISSLEDIGQYDIDSIIIGSLSHAKEIDECLNEYLTEKNIAIYPLFLAD